MSVCIRRVAFLVLGLGAVWFSPARAASLPGFATVKAAYTSSDAWLLDRRGRALQRLRLDATARRLPWTPLEEISPALKQAVILSEDRRFHEHSGVDWSAAGKAAWDALRLSRSRGASTLSMQLVGLIDEDYRRRGQRSVFDKIGQSLAALRLEQRWQKRQILEAYLNLASFRGELQGVSALSRQLFGKWPDGLDNREAALAAALLRAPNAAPARVAQRACLLLKEMAHAEECTGLEELAARSLARPSQRFADAQVMADDTPTLAPHLANKLLQQAGQRLRTTLDADLQAYAMTALRRNLRELARRNAQDGAVLVLDNASGEVLAWVGSSGELSTAAEVDGVVALRQAGSTLKPFLYALAFERRDLTPASLIEDAPLTLETGNGLYAPQNYEADYRGWVSARMALAASLNVPAVRTLVRIGPDIFQQRLRQAGLSSLNHDGEWYGYSLALGSADISLLQLANAYRTLANAGVWSPLRLLARADAIQPPCRSAGCEGAFGGASGGTRRGVYSPQAAYLVADILADRSARSTTFGLESWLATPYWAAAKTGTSKDMRDNWCLGFSRRYTVAVWVGNASGAPMHDVSGVSGAAPVWREVMDWLHRGDAARGRPVVLSAPPPVPPGIVVTSLRFEPAIEPPRRESFVAGTETRLVRAAAGQALAQIAYPSEGMIIALDPDIPPARQSIPLRLSAVADPQWQWRIDNQPRTLGRAVSKTPVRWIPQPGTHRLRLEDGRGRLVEEVRFEVRALRGSSRRSQ